MKITSSSKLKNYIAVWDDKEEFIIYLINLDSIDFCYENQGHVRVEFGAHQNWIELDISLVEFYEAIREVASFRKGKKQFALDFGGTIVER